MNTVHYIIQRKSDIVMAIKVNIRWMVFDAATNQRVEEVAHTTMVNDYSDIQPKTLQKLSQDYQAKALEKDLKFQDKLGPAGDRGGYVISEIQDDSKQYDIVIVCSVLNH